jgi:hypothetical protein
VSSLSLSWFAHRPLVTGGVAVSAVLAIGAGVLAQGGSAAALPPRASATVAVSPSAAGQGAAVAANGTPVSPDTPPVPAVPAVPATPRVLTYSGAPIRAAAAQYPLSYAAAPTAVVSADAAAPARNPKSAPLTVAGHPAALVPFPHTPAALVARPGTAALPAGSIGVTAPGAAVTNAAVVALIEQYFPAAQWAAASAVSLCESGQRNVVSVPNTDGSRDYGIFQINNGGTLQGLLARIGPAGGGVAQALVADWNVRAAAQLWSERGWQPWTCARKLGLMAAAPSAG